MLAGNEIWQICGIQAHCRIMFCNYYNTMGSTAMCPAKVIDVRTGGRGTGDTCSLPQPAKKGGSVPTARAMPVHAILGLTMRYHMKFQE